MYVIFKTQRITRNFNHMMLLSLGRHIDTKMYVLQVVENKTIELKRVGDKSS